MTNLQNFQLYKTQLTRLLDEDFLTEISKQKNRNIFARIIALDINENPVDRIEGRIVSGSISVDGSSSVRRTCSLSLVTEDLNINEYYWAIKTKFKLEIGIENKLTGKYAFSPTNNYPPIVWFSQGYFLVSTFNTSFSTNNCTISLQGKDKMCLLNGDLGGQLFASIDFGTEEVISSVVEPVDLTSDSSVEQILSNTLNKYYVEYNGNSIIETQEVDLNTKNPFYLFILDKNGKYKKEGNQYKLLNYTEENKDGQLYNIYKLVRSIKDIYLNEESSASTYEFINILSYALEDGDYASALDSAINNAVQNGETTDGKTVCIYFPPGKYNFYNQRSEPLVFAGINNIMIYAYEATFLNKSTDDKTSIIEFDNCNNVSFLGATLDGNYKCQRGLSFVNCQNALIQDVTVKNIGNNNLQSCCGLFFVQDCAYSTILDCTIENVIAGQYTGAYIFASGVQILNSSNHTYNRYITIENIKINNIGNNKDNSANIDGDGIYIIQPPDQCKIEEGQDEENRGESFIKIINPYITNCTKRGIKIVTRCVSILNGYVEIGSWGGSAIELQVFRDTIIKGVKIKSTGNYSCLGICGGDGFISIEDCEFISSTGNANGISLLTLVEKYLPFLPEGENIIINNCKFNNTKVPIFAGLTSLQSDKPVTGNLLKISNCQIGYFKGDYAIQLYHFRDENNRHVQLCRYKSLNNLIIENITFLHGQNEEEIFSKNDIHFQNSSSSSNRRLLLLNDLNSDPLEIKNYMKIDLDNIQYNYDHFLTFNLKNVKAQFGKKQYIYGQLPPKQLPIQFSSSETENIETSNTSENQTINYFIDEDNQAKIFVKGGNKEGNLKNFIQIPLLQDNAPITLKKNKSYQIVYKQNRIDTELEGSLLYARLLTPNEQGNPVEISNPPTIKSFVNNENIINIHPSGDLIISHVLLDDWKVSGGKFSTFGGDDNEWGISFEIIIYEFQPPAITSFSISEDDIFPNVYYQRDLQNFSISIVEEDENNDSNDNNDNSNNDNNEQEYYRRNKEFATFYYYYQIRTLEKNSLKKIIRESVHAYAQEPYHNIIINDLDDYGLEQLTYYGQISLYGLYDTGIEEFTDFMLESQLPIEIQNAMQQSDNFSFNSLNDNSFVYGTVFSFNGSDYTLSKFTYGSDIGYRLTNLVYPGDLISNVGESLTSVLDKIKQVLGEFEYFYDLEGRFIFQKKKNYLETSWNQITEDDTNFYVDPTQKKFAFIFEDNTIISSFQNTPNLSNIKNDFVVWGKRKGVSGADIPIHARYAIDKKPVYYKNFNDDIFVINDNILNETDSKSSKVFVVDWREIIYQMALDFFKGQGSNPDNFLHEIGVRNPEYYPSGYTGYEQYYTDMEGYWRSLYNPNYKPQKIYSQTNSLGKVLSYPIVDGYDPIEYYITKDSVEYPFLLSEEQKSMIVEDSDSRLYWNKNVFQYPEVLDFWFDFLEDSFDLSYISVQQIGDRTKVVQEDKAKSIIYSTIPNIVLYENQEKQQIDNFGYETDSKSGYNFIQVPLGFSQFFVTSSKNLSVKNKIDSLLYQHCYGADNITLNTLPIYYLEPNTRVLVKDTKNNINGEYIINRITVPLTYNGMMSISANKAPQRFY